MKARRNRRNLKAVVRPKTQDCCACEHREFVGETGLRCRAGHKPRFYLPRWPHDEAYGWKRRCTDFTLGKHVAIIHLPNKGSSVSGPAAGTE